MKINQDISYETALVASKRTTTNGFHKGIVRVHMTTNVGEHPCSFTAAITGDGLCWKLEGKILHVERAGHGGSVRKREANMNQALGMACAALSGAAEGAINAQAAYEDDMFREATGQIRS